MDHDFHNQRWSRDELARDQQVQRDLDEATPSMGSAGLIIGAVILIILGVVYFGPSAGTNTNVASGDKTGAAAPTTAPTKP